MVKQEDLSQQVATLAKQFDEGFLELARVLRQLQETSPDEFRSVVQKAGLSLRKAYYLVTIDRTFGKLRISKNRLRKIGWTKLKAITPHVDKYKVPELLDLAEKHTAKSLETILGGKDPVANTHSVLLYFSPEDYATFAEAILEHGGTRSRRGRGLENKEQALLNLIVQKKKDENVRKPSKRKNLEEQSQD
ncbi:hypothetical protein [Sinorhizobium fredii]|uniref:hypothetical protein n=1 Tax=Rhizobium fredii TaxID=380 RepID=UPI00129572B0|nr:hypothetical protein [Sinorhizobium fredii]MQW94097.1 hypothetical protein [Sinorhizobium fredii]